MSIYVNKDTRIICQGITGTQASFHVKQSLQYGTQIVGGVTPEKGGTLHLGLPVFNTIAEAVKETQATSVLTFVPAQKLKYAIKESIDANIDLIVSIAAGVPLQDMLEIKNMLQHSHTKLIGPNTPGIITPMEARMGIFPIDIHKRGNIGVVSRSSTLTYEAVLEINRAGFGQSTVVGLGDDMLIGMDFIDVLKEFFNDEETKAVVMIGQLNGAFEEVTAMWYKKQKIKKPVIAFIAGDAVPFGQNIGYAGDVLTNGYVSVQDKKDALTAAGITVVNHINDISGALAKL